MVTNASIHLRPEIEKHSHSKTLKEINSSKLGLVNFRCDIKEHITKIVFFDYDNCGNQN